MWLRLPLVAVTDTLPVSEGVVVVVVVVLVLPPPPQLTLAASRQAIMMASHASRGRVFAARSVHRGLAAPSPAAPKIRLKANSKRACGHPGLKNLVTP